ncbi:PhzF family phenazine biosynthesis isomerase [Sinorhizobium medicae]|uniref:Phenazine biosynthesis protein PhzF family n=2 Tax=Sinorhizobium medicae TaxID=110321 RepID=A6UCV5_SINMW|nr:PhzF family phenazine biosynthesis protein [Sinorhizobium medicae]ABR61485.1 phenazine biosynthesis protein PhzF family [Sinorhizobium medicae WSM419]MBO1959586.1 PhzF family phenazine biosynthesis protein [Sinorhizobium medicae]MDX0405209.1 PhzF family phenazine biosynthesis isomerase [Sinorhizobium medicae]MDX0410806.1 PhzF family phenazine biosynthesis isomerase [Sinorhizobium medicae]MDX0417233.1 PhzF family phenazine biosynthesis isomerase [Sinorhizobium medicae]
MSSVSYATVDVFTAERFAGNQLAVIPDARGLSDAQMQAIATEFAYSEVTFVLPPENPENTARVRIFTPTTEVPFAGHPNVGTAFVLGRQQEIFGRKPGQALRFEEKAGLVEVTLLGNEGVVSGARIIAPQTLQIGPAIDPAVIAASASLRSDELSERAHRPVRISVGLPFAVAEVRDLAVLSKARPNVSAFEEANTRYPLAEDSFSLFLYARTLERPWYVRARMFAPLDNVIEDPATGSASAALGAYLVSLLPDADAKVELVIEQGVEMGRRSIIAIAVGKRGGAIREVSISGDCVTAMRGVIEV